MIHSITKNPTKENIEAINNELDKLAEFEKLNPHNCLFISAEFKLPNGTFSIARYYPSNPF